MREHIELTGGARMAYALDDHTDPWRPADTVIFLHGIAESSEAWRAWVPYFSRRHKVIRPDLRGFGASTPMPLEFEWSLDVLVSDVDKLMTSLGLQSAHLVGAKLGGLIAMKFAARHPDRVKTLVIPGATVALAFLAPSIPGKVERMQREGIAAWAESTMRDRMGSGMDAQAVNWWIDLMGRAPASSVLGVYRMLPAIDIRSELPEIKAPTLVITSEDSGYYGSVEAFRAWQQTIPDSELQTLPGDSYHVAASHPDACAAKAAAFVAARAGSRA